MRRVPGQNVVASRAFWLAAAVSLAPGVGRADELIASGMGPQKVTFTGFRDGKLFYQTARGDPAERDATRVQQVVVDGETALNAAEAAAAAGKAASAVDDYVKAARGAGAPWARAFAARRLLDALGGGTDRFDARVAAYLAQTAVEPATAAKPALPDRGSRLLDVAVADTETALRTPNLGSGPTLALLNFLADLHRRRGDDAAVAATVERLAKAAGGVGGDPALAGQLAGLRIEQARAALKARDYAAADKIIADNRAAFVDPAQQSDALFLLAQVRLARAGAGDTAALQDAALAFMRVVAHFGDLAGRPNVLASLRETAGILEKIGDKDDAAKVYAQIARDFADDPTAVTQAQADAARLKPR